MIFLMKQISLNKTYSVICKNFKKESRKLILNSSFKGLKINLLVLKEEYNETQTTVEYIDDSKNLI